MGVANLSMECLPPPHFDNLSHCFTLLRAATQSTQTLTEGVTVKVQEWVEFKERFGCGPKGGKILLHPKRSGNCAVCAK